MLKIAIAQPSYVVNSMSTIHKTIMYFVFIKMVKKENSAFDVYKNKI